ncbi:MAG: ABC transporter ATP-binding protein [Candidatus Cloacimonadota bacterium]|nr:MAG: ABC transporter ATP-binding protein [Candidatus Cloacimonadota bacterium]
MRHFAVLKEYFAKYRYRILLGILALVIVNGLQLLLPRIVKYVVDGIINSRMTDVSLLRWAFIILIIAIFMALFRFFWRYFVLGTSHRIREHLRNRFFAHLQSLSMTYFNNTKTGELMALATNDILAVRRAVGIGIVIIVDTVFLTIGALIMMFRINSVLTFLALIPLPILSLTTFFMGRALHVRFRNVQDAFAKLTDKVQENLSGIRVVKAFVQESFEVNDFRTHNQHFLKENMRLVKIWGAFFPLLMMLGGISTAIVLLWGGRQVIINFLTLGDFVAFTMYLSILTWPMMGIGWVVNIFQQGAASMARINTVLNATPEIANLPNAVSITKSLKGDISFSNVFFKYSEEYPYVLKSLNLHISAKEQVAIVGRTGEGKSTLVSLIPRIFEPERGVVHIDCINIRDYRLEDLRKRIGFVPQDTFLFSLSLRENIAFGNIDIPMECIIKAAKIAQIYDEIMELQDGFETVVGERGISLSGGQRQRIAIARAIILNPDILILDDALSSVDTETEEKIVKNLMPMIKERTTIIITHRISSIKQIRRIIVIGDNTLKEDGNHDELISLGGIYKNLYEKQMLEDKLKRSL